MHILSANVLRATMLAFVSLLTALTIWAYVNASMLYPEHRGRHRFLFLAFGVIVFIMTLWAWRRLETTFALPPRFTTREQLQPHPEWRAYLERVYKGPIPNTAFPLDLGEFHVFHKAELRAAGIRAPDPLAIACPPKHGSASTNMSFSHDNPNWLWISHPVTPVPPHTRVEVVHSNDTNSTRPFHDTRTGYWMYHARGSGVFYDVGRTRVFTTHESAERLAGERITDERFYQRLRDAGLDSIQFTRHDDMKCGNTALEIVDLGGAESQTCLPGLRSGWGGADVCVCDEAQRFATCS